jgi:multicomponent Na+:H+ antiporter subunit E
VAARAAFFFAFWLMISGGQAMLLVVGLVTVAIATWTSLRLLPARGLRMRPFVAATLAMRVLRQWAVAGLDVARRAFDPALPLRPGFVVFPLRLPVGTARCGFCALSSLQPGALPAGTDRNDRLVVHCLDVEQSVVANMAAEEVLFMGALKHD